VALRNFTSTSSLYYFSKEKYFWSVHNYFCLFTEANAGDILLQNKKNSRGDSTFRTRKAEDSLNKRKNRMKVYKFKEKWALSFLTKI